MTGIFVPWTHYANGPGWIEDGSGCHIWVGAMTSSGYGAVRIGHTRTLRVHRVRYEREVGPIPAGTELDHFYCNNKACCNPAHVRPVTRRENALRADGVASLCAAKTHCPQGHEYSGANLIAGTFKRTGHRKCRICDNARRRKGNLFGAAS